MIKKVKYTRIRSDGHVVLPDDCQVIGFKSETYLNEIFDYVIYIEAL